MRLEQFFETHPLTGRAGFCHLRPAKHLETSIGTLKKGLSSATLERFEKLFAKLNALLP